jgi:hypothetical protein
MRFCISSSCLLLCLTASHSAQSQTSTPSSFQRQTQIAASAKPFSVVNLTATAQWTAGSLQESGTAQLQANADGSTNVQLSLGQASRTESQTKTDASRACVWTDSTATSHNIVGPNCLIAVPWFAPSLYTQPSAQLPSMVGTIDNGEISKDGATLHQISYLLNLGSDTTATNQMVSNSTVKVFYDPQTLLPVSLEYFMHPDNNDLQNIPVRVAFSKYQSVSGVMLPFHVEKYINRTLQLTLDVTNASIE